MRTLPKPSVALAALGLATQAGLAQQRYTTDEALKEFNDSTAGGLWGSFVSGLMGPEGKKPPPAPAAARDASNVVDFRPFDPNEPFPAVDPEDEEHRLFRNSKLKVWTTYGDLKIDHGTGAGYEDLRGRVGVRPGTKFFTGRGDTELELRTEQGGKILVAPGTEFEIHHLSAGRGNTRIGIRFRSGAIVWRNSHTAGGQFRIRTNEVEVISDHTFFMTARRPEENATAIFVAEDFVTVRPSNPALPPRVVRAGEQVVVYADRMEPGATEEIGGGLTVRIPRRSIRPGQQFSVPVEIYNPSGLANFNLEIEYGRALQVAGPIRKGAGTSRTQILFEANPGSSSTPVARLGLSSPNAVALSGTIAEIPLKHLGGQPPAAGERIPIKIRIDQIQDARGTNLPAKTIDGEVFVSNPPPPSAAGGAGGAPPGAEADFDGDGRVTARDAEAALKMSVGNLPVDLRFDASGDRKVLAEDSRLILQLVPSRGF